MNLTKKQKETLDFIKKEIAKNSYPPTVREIAKAINVNSSATAYMHLNKLYEKGYLKIDKNKSRGISLICENEYLSTNDDTVKIPLLGKTSAGNPITAIENPNEFFSVPANIIPMKNEVFALHVEGDSMINAGIFDNDYVIIKRCNTAQNNDVVVAMNDLDEVTLKRYFKEKDHVRLQPENDDYKPIILTNVHILGKAIGLYRKF